MTNNRPLHNLTTRHRIGLLFALSCAYITRLRLPLALDDAEGRRIGASDSFERLESAPDEPGSRAYSIHLVDGRTLWILRPPPRGRGRAPMMAGGLVAPMRGPGPAPLPGWTVPWLSGGLGLAALLLVLFVAVAAGAWPVVRRLTRRLEALQRGVEAFGAGAA